MSSFSSIFLNRFSVFWFLRRASVAIPLHLAPFFGNTYLTEIRAKQVEDYVQEQAKAASFGRVNLELQQLKTILNTAVRWNLLRESPAKSVKPLRLPDKEPPYITRDQVAELYKECAGWIHTFVAIAQNTDLRLSEVLALKWEDIDLRNGVIKIRSDEDFVTKSRRNREVPVNCYLHSVLKKAPTHITFPHVIFTRGGESPTRPGVRDCFLRALKRAGLPVFRIHDLRHSFGTTLAGAGIDVRTIQERMGHSDLKTTMKYLHAAPNRMRGAVEMLYLDGTTQEKVDEAESSKKILSGQDMDTGVQAGAQAG